MRPLCLLALAAVILLHSVSHARIPLGAVAATFDCLPNQVLADPARPRVYVADGNSGNLLVIDTSTLAVVATVPVGPVPSGLALARDGRTLYVAAAGSTLEGIAVVDLDTLTVRAHFKVPAPAIALAAGLDDRLNVVAQSDSGAGYQLDGSTGTQQATFYPEGTTDSTAQISPDVLWPAAA